MPDVHSKTVAPSAAVRWINCPASALLCAAQGDVESPYAQEGTDAHSLCEYLLKKALAEDAKDPRENLTYYNQEMQEAAEDYVTFVMEQVASYKDPIVMVEQRLDFSRWVPDGFGTGDCVIIADDVLHIIDFKYGVGVVVPAEKNPQLSCYALGAYDSFSCVYDMTTVKLSIFQPRRSNYDTYVMSASDLLSWADNTLAPAAKDALSGNGKFCAGTWCKFCKVKATCKERANANMALAAYDFKSPEALSDEEIAQILPQIDDLVSWADDVKAYVLQQAIAGKHYEGFKLVEGRSTRKYTDEGAIASIVSDAGYEPYEKKLLGITAMTSELGKKKFNELLGSYVTKAPGKPVLVASSDKRPEMTTATNDFADN